MELIHDRDQLIEVLSGLLKQLDKAKSDQYPIWHPAKAEQAVKEKIDDLPEAIRLACVYVYHFDVGMSEHSAPTSYGLEGYCQKMSDQGLWQLLEPILNRQVNKSPKDLLMALKELSKKEPEAPNKVVAPIKPAKPEPKPDKRYTLINTVQFTVSADYKHETQLTDFVQQHKQEFGHGKYYNDDISDDHFSQVSNRLVPGQTYTAKIFQINQDVTSKNNLTFLANQGAILVGAQGLSVFYQQAKAQFPVDKWLVSFDEKSKLWQDAIGNHRVPYIKRRSDGYCKFRLGYFECDWSDGHCLLCVCDC